MGALGAHWGGSLGGNWEHWCNWGLPKLTAPTFPMTVMLSPAPAGVGKVRPRPFPDKPLPSPAVSNLGWGRGLEGA